MRALIYTIFSVFSLLSIGCAVKSSELSGLYLETTKERKIIYLKENIENFPPCDSLEPLGETRKIIKRGLNLSLMENTMKKNNAVHADFLLCVNPEGVPISSELLKYNGIYDADFVKVHKMTMLYRYEKSNKRCKQCGKLTIEGRLEKLNNRLF